MALRHRLETLGTKPDGTFLSRQVSKAKQREYALAASQRLNYDMNKAVWMTPFILYGALNRDDARITTRWDEHNFQMAVLGIFHEAGHGLFEQNVAAKYDAYVP